MPLGARAWIGDGERGALVAADGTIDWYGPLGDGAPWCWRLLDPAGGAVRVGPVRSGTGVTRRLPRHRQSYRDGTNVAELVTGEGDGRVRVVDFVPWSGPNDSPPGRLVRLVTALTGPVDVEIEVLPAGRFRAAREVSGWTDGVVIDGTAVRSGTELRPEPLDRDHPRWRGVRRLSAGETFVVTIDDSVLSHPPLSPDTALRLLEQTETAWRSWAWGTAPTGDYGTPVRRSALTVRSLTGNRIGAPAAAGTTSLARRAGSERTTDGRVIRWTDAASAAITFARLGLVEDATKAEAWLRRAAEATDPPWPAALSAEGGPLREREELGLAGWRRSQPVVVGADPAADLDVYGDVVAAVHGSQRGPAGFDDTAGFESTSAGPLAAAWPALAAAADWVVDHWREPDSGAWGIAGPTAQLVASKVQAWSALDRMARLARTANPLDLQAVVWQQAAQEILRWLERDGRAPDGGLQRAAGPADDADSALLRVAWRGPWPVRHPLVTATVDRTLERLGSGSLVYRYDDRVDDGRAGPDSPDVVASLWAVRALANLERWEEGHERMEAVIALGGRLGVLADAADPLSGELLGNLPSSAAHLALVDAALALAAGPR